MFVLLELATGYHQSIMLHVKEIKANTRPVGRHKWDPKGSSYVPPRVYRGIPDLRTGNPVLAEGRYLKTNIGHYEHSDPVAAL